MATVREVSFELLRAHEMRTVFGNPGSTELTMLTEFPDDFRYVLGLQELVAVGMADGYAQSSGTVGHVNLHTAPGLGNAGGGLFNAWANKTPLLVTAGQQVRPQILFEANLTNRDATRVPEPFVKWSHEPVRAQDVPAALARAIHHASLPPRGPAFVSIPMDDWTQEADPGLAPHTLGRRVDGRTMPDPDGLRALAARLRAARAPVLVAGPDIDASGGWAAAVSLAEHERLAVWATPATGGGRLGFPEDHPQFAGVLPPAIAAISAALEGHDLVLVAGSSVFPYYPYAPGPFLPGGAELVLLSSDPAEIARAPVGDALIGDVGLALGRLAELSAEAGSPAGRELPAERAPLAAPAPAGDGSEAMSGSEAMAALGAAWPPDAVVVLESPSVTLALRNRLRLGRPGSYLFSAGGGLGFGLPASLGVALAQPSRPVVCVIGEGSAQYAIQAFWTAATYRIPVKVLVLRNREYGILKAFGQMEQVSGVPGLDLPALDVAAVAAGYGVTSRTVTEPAELEAALREDLAVHDGPRLIQADVAPGMAME